MSFGMIIWTQNLEKKQNVVTWIQTCIGKYVETRFDTSNYELDYYLKGKNGLMKDELGRKIMKKFAALRAKTYSYLMDNNDKDKTVKGTRKCVIKQKFKFEDYEHFW